jgi:hypothetical protein
VDDLISLGGGLVLDDIALVVAVEFAVKILAWGDADDAFKVAHRWL